MRIEQIALDPDRQHPAPEDIEAALLEGARHAIGLMIAAGKTPLEAVGQWANFYVVDVVDSIAARVAAEYTLNPEFAELIKPDVRGWPHVAGHIPWQLYLQVVDRIMADDTHWSGALEAALKAWVRQP
jgi:hypothetical protein